MLDLSWYGDARGRAVARWVVPLVATAHPRQPGGFRCSSATFALHVCAAAGARGRPAARPGLRRTAHRRLAVRGAARGHAASRGRLPAGHLPHHHLPTHPLKRGADVQRDRPGPHDDRPQLPGGGLRSRPAAARRHVRRRRDLPGSRARRATTSSSTSAWRRSTSTRSSAPSATATSTTSRPSRASTPRRRCWRGPSPTGSPSACGPGTSAAPATG